MTKLLAITRIIDLMNEKIGRAISWLALLMILVQFAVVVMRYIFGLGSIFMQESIVYMHALIFLVAAGYTLLHDDHVRVDIFYGSASPRRKALVNFIGVLVFLWPLCVLILIVSTKFITAAWAVKEAREKGIKAGLFRPITLWPFPEDAFLAAAAHAQAVIVPEMNAGQLVLEAERLINGRAPVTGINRIDGEPISPAEVLERIEELARIEEVA